MALSDHQRTQAHCFCQLCNQFFINKEDLKQHRRAVHQHRCGGCTSVFENAIRLSNHQRGKGHCYCEECDSVFGTEQTLSQHLRSTVHVSQFRCLECEQDFASEQALVQHLHDKKIHRPTGPSAASTKDSTYGCDKCHREFEDRTALKQHQESVVHRPLSQLKCIASSKCKGRFTSPSALLHHLESGACRSGLNRAALNQLIQSHDAGNVITFGTQADSLLDSTADDGVSTESCSPGLMTPSSHSSETYSGLMSPQLTPSTPLDGYFGLGLGQPGINQAGKLSCPLCPVDSKGFRTIQALHNHLSSPAHAPKVFHCPVDLIAPAKKGKQTKELIKEFSTLSGLTQHVESGACGGSKALKGAMGFVQERLKDLGFQSVRLLN
ncbi:MAG: hypothetical protein L6R40_007497 [Gallowayella cf. fulva]|nr:MAG: hypothetical protein L6R40_007497 [Xanthomendoza cf. fulva]